MDSFGDILVGIGVLLTLASFGIATFAAFGLMAALGLVTELSFRRIFFISFGVALFVPILFGSAMIGVLSEEEVQTQISENLREALPSSEQLFEEIEGTFGPTDDEQRALEDGTMTPDELEQRLEERLQRVVPGADVQIEDGSVRIVTPDETVNIQID